MLKVQFKIMPKPRGNFMPRLVAFRQYIESDELKLNPHFVFKREYQLPGKIYFRCCDKELRCGDSVCAEINTLSFEIDTYVRCPEPDQPNIKAFLNYRACSCTCPDCHAFLEWRPGDPPDYSDYIAVFEQVTKDMLKAWHESVRQAYNSGETKEIDISLGGVSGTGHRGTAKKAKPRTRLTPSGILGIKVTPDGNVGIGY